MKKIVLIILLHLANQVLFSQARVTRIYTDYNGFFTSAATAVNPVMPENDHNLLGFTYNGTTYSTGVDDAKLTAHSVDFVAQTFRAIPLNNVPTSGPSYFVGLGQMYDGIHNGVDNGSTHPFPGNPISSATLASFLTDGINGLNVGTGLANIPAGSVLRFNLGASGISPSAIGDGIPDILFVQIADPSSNGDRMKFVNSSGATVGQEFTFNLSSTFLYPRLAYWKADFYNPNSTQTSSSFINTMRPIAMLAVDLSELGITASNYTQVEQLVYTTAGTSDPAFVAFNEPSVSLPAKLDVLFQPDIYQTNIAMNPAFQVRLLNSFNQPVIQPNVAITVSVETGNGALSGTFTALTDANGIAYFHDLRLDGNNTHTLRFVSSSLTPAISGPLNWSTLLPVRWSNFSGTLKSEEIHLNWSTTMEQNTHDFLVEQSSTGNQWKKIGSVDAAGNSGSFRSYTFVDKNPQSGQNFYRLIQRDINGRQQVSNTIRVHYNSERESFRVISNPVVSKQLWVEASRPTTMQIYSSVGSKVLQKSISAGRQAVSLDALPAGLYYVKTGDITLPIVVQ